MTWLRVQRRNTLWVTSKAAYEGRATEHCGLPHPRPARLFLWSRHPLGNLSNPCQQAGNQSVKEHPPKPDLRVHSQLSVVTVQMPDLHCMQICCWQTIGVVHGSLPQVWTDCSPAGHHSAVRRILPPDHSRRGQRTLQRESSQRPGTRCGETGCSSAQTFLFFFWEEEALHVHQSQQLQQTFDSDVGCSATGCNAT